MAKDNRPVDISGPPLEERAEKYERDTKLLIERGKQGSSMLLDLVVTLQHKVWDAISNFDKTLFTLTAGSIALAVGLLGSIDHELNIPGAFVTSLLSYFTLLIVLLSAQLKNVMDKNKLGSKAMAAVEALDTQVEQMERGILGVTHKLPKSDVKEDPTKSLFTELRVWAVVLFGIASLILFIFLYANTPFKNGSKSFPDTLTVVDRSGARTLLLAPATNDIDTARHDTLLKNERGIK